LIVAKKLSVLFWKDGTASLMQLRITEEIALDTADYEIAKCRRHVDYVSTWTNKIAVISFPPQEPLTYLKFIA
jgi:hypothetical protein